MRDIIRMGKVSAVDYADGMVSVVYHDKDDSVTRPIPMLSDEYHMPEVGDMVLVVHLSNGTEAGVVLGRPWNSKNRPAEGGKGLYRKEFGRKPGEAIIRYKDGVLQIRAPQVLLENLCVEGDMTVTGTLTVRGSIVATGDVKAGATSLARHIHDDSRGGRTSEPV